jgi:hypothetical protein
MERFRYAFIAAMLELIRSAMAFPP